MYKVFVDGSAGTTGLKILDRLKTRDDISLVTIPEKFRKDNKSRAEAMNSSDAVFLCLPDDAAREAATFVENNNTIVVDTSTAHRTNPDWTYGFAELEGQKEKIRTSKRIANPGCHASGFIALIAPLVENDVIGKDTLLSCFSLTGYSGGGKKMIAEYNEAIKDDKYRLLKSSSGFKDSIESLKALFAAPRMYGLDQTHKHLPEMVKISGIESEPVFCPIVGDFYSGMEVTVPLFNNDIDKIKSIYKNYYGIKPSAVWFADDASENGLLSAAAFAGRDDMQISVYGNNNRIILVSRFDNLGKGASGAAIQNMNIALGLPEFEGLIL